MHTFLSHLSTRVAGEPAKQGTAKPVALTLATAGGTKPRDVADFQQVFDAPTRVLTQQINMRGDPKPDAPIKNEETDISDAGQGDTAQQPIEGSEASDDSEVSPVLPETVGIDYEAEEVVLPTKRGEDAQEAVVPVALNRGTPAAPIKHRGLDEFTAANPQTAVQSNPALRQVETLLTDQHQGRHRAEGNSVLQSIAAEPSKEVHLVGSVAERTITGQLSLIGNVTQQGQTNQSFVPVERTTDPDAVPVRLGVPQAFVPSNGGRVDLRLDASPSIEQPVADRRAEKIVVPQDTPIIRPASSATNPVSPVQTSSVMAGPSAKSAADVRPHTTNLMPDAQSTALPRTNATVSQTDRSPAPRVDQVTVASSAPVINPDKLQQGTVPTMSFKLMDTTHVPSTAPKPRITALEPLASVASRSESSQSPTPPPTKTGAVIATVPPDATTRSPASPFVDVQVGRPVSRDRTAAVNEPVPFASRASPSKPVENGQARNIATPTVPVPSAIASRPDGNDPVLDQMRAIPLDHTSMPRMETASTPITQTAHRHDLPMQVARQLAEAFQNASQRPVDITLSPEELGRVRLALSSTETGMVMHVTAERPETLELMRRHIAELGQEFQDIGYADISFSFAGEDAQQSDTSAPDPAPVAESLPEALTEDAIEIALSTAPPNGVDIRL